VSTVEMLDFRDRTGYWIEDWEHFAGRGSVLKQVRFDREWGALRRYCADRGVRLFGDLPIYIADRSADHLAHPELFKKGFVAGVPPDAFSASGQLWRNPLYDWPANRRHGYDWWIERLRRTLSLFDFARIDHFRGFVAYWAVPAGARDASGGTWRRGPGRALFDAVIDGLEGEGGTDPLPLVAEDLGVITPPVGALRDALGLPGMIVLQFGFDPRAPRSVHRPANHAEWRFVYTGTHDHDTARGWYAGLEPRIRRLVDRELAPFREREPWWGLIRLAFSSPARVAMIQAQDVLGLGSEARMNHPGRATASWRWQMEPGALTRSLAARLRKATEAAGRLVSPPG
jgi:4-alpha-glucanotransferase